MERKKSTNLFVDPELLTAISHVVLGKVGLHLLEQRHSTLNERIKLFKWDDVINRFFRVQMEPPVQQSWSVS